MERPTRLFAHRLARDRHIDVDVILDWPLSKLWEHMAFYITENPEWQKEYEESKLTPEQKAKALANFLGAK